MDAGRPEEQAGARNAAFRCPSIFNPPRVEAFRFPAGAGRPQPAAGSRLLGDHSEGDTPVPIPNTAVKPIGADDTAAFSCGKVGSRRI